MCPHTSKNRSKPLIKSSRTKQSYKSSYTIPEWSPEKKQAKAKTNVFRSKVTSISRWKSSTKGGRSTLASGWRRQRTPMVLLDGVANVLKTTAHIA